ncbi:MAG: peptide chain release factor N(5)-glutamine methyltransferase [Clostridiales bacterium]|nr:peptide chain release factor N(5)-glutamine methyltransferase [Clostridiales bacterium]
MVMYTIKGLLKKGANILVEAEIDNPILDAEVILAFILGVDREKLIADWDKIVDESHVKSFIKAIEERALKKPVQYITGKQEFMGLDFSVGQGVLIPRWDTEIAVERILKLLKSMKAPKIADMCAGSGAIGISLAYYIKDSFVYMTDISKVALTYCAVNAGKHGVADRVKILEGDLAKPLFNLEGDLDVLVSNPPYISKKEMDELPDGVRCYEPHLALYGGVEGFDYYEKIIKDAPKLLKKGGILIFEIGYNQGHTIKEMLKKAGFFRDIVLEKDLAGLDRCIYCFLKE